MKPYFLRSSLFNICFYVITALACIAFLPTLLMPRGAFLWVVHVWTWTVHKLEKLIMGLDFEVRGVENIPKTGSFIVAAKHQSAYETLKLHTLFKDPAIILKQELLKIPLWGLYLKKISPIAIDRSDRESAVASINAGALRVKEENRPIIIFPQGTRVRIDHTPKDKPYRIGVARIQETTELPIVPVALNTGYFWPRMGWCKKPGCVVFEFLPAIEHGLSREDLMAKIESSIEERSNDLLNEAQEAEKTRKKSGLAKLFGVTLIILAILYSVWWFYIAGMVEKEHSLFLTKSEQIETLARNNAGNVERHFKNARVSGFPGPVKLKIEQEHFIAPTFQIVVNNIKASSWPLPRMPLNLNTSTITLQSFNVPVPIEMDSLEAKFIPKGRELVIDYASLKKNDFEIFASGSVFQGDDGDLENIDVDLTLKNISSFLSYLETLGMLDQQTMLFARAGLSSFEQDGSVTIPLTVRNNNLFAGPFLLMPLP